MWDRCRSQVPARQQSAVYEIVNEHLRTTLGAKRGLFAKVSKDLSPLRPLLEALQAHNWADLERYLNHILLGNISYHDTAAGESFYHALFIGILLHLPGYQLRSNREAGLGRYDCQLTPREPDPSKAGYILEFKQVSPSSNFSKTLTAAQRQIKNLGYAQDLRSAGIQTIHSIAIAVSGKQAKLRAQAA